MDTVIIAIIVTAAVVLSIYFSVRHARGKGGCCGGGSCGKCKPPKLDNPIIARKRIEIEGMHCEHCKNSVESSLNNFKGASARVDLKHHCANVDTEREIPDDELAKAVETLGFKVIKVENVSLQN